MRNVIPMLLAALIGLSGCASVPKAGSYQQVSAQEAMNLMAARQGYIILDVRTSEEFAQRHIVGAMNIPNETIGDEAPAQLPDKGQTIFVYCRSGNRSKQAAAKLAKLGYTNIIEFGGINSWTGETVAGAL